MPCNRDRKHRFILKFGKVKTSNFCNGGVSSVLASYGLEAFEEWALDLMISDIIEQERAAIQRNIKNRECVRAFARRSDQMAALRQPAE